MIHNICDLTLGELGDPINMTLSPMVESIKDMETVADFQKLVKCVKMSHLVRHWHPRVSKNGQIPQLLGNCNCFFVNAETIPGRFTSPTEEQSKMFVLEQVIRFYHSMFPNEVYHTEKPVLVPITLW